MNKVIRLYVAGPWFTPQAEKTMSMMEQFSIMSPKVKSYRPRLDGVKLKPGEFHDPNLRQAIFEDNIKHIDSCDFVIANLDSRDGVMDTGTLWEIGYAVSKGISVYTYDPAHKVKESLNGLYTQIEGDIPDQLGLSMFFEDPIQYRDKVVRKEISPKPIRKGLLITPRGQSDKYTDLAIVMNDTFDGLYKWAAYTEHPGFDDDYYFMMADTDIVVAVIDDKDPIVSYTIGYAYQKGIPVITYTNYDYEVNIMLLCSVLKHVKGVKDLRIVLGKIYDSGIQALPKFDHSRIKAE